MILWDVTALLEAALGKSRLDSVYLRFQFNGLKIAVTSTLHQVLAPGRGPVCLMGSWSDALPRHAGTKGCLPDLQVHTFSLLVTLVYEYTGVP